jgi:hypothetical protein
LATFLARWTANGLNSALAAPSAPGSTVISSRASYAQGQQIAIQSAAHTYQLAFYTVQSVSGTGPFALTLDRPVLLQFATGDQITGLGTSIPANIHLLCNGMKFTGTPARHVEFAGTFQSSVDGCVADTSLGAATDYWFAYDAGGFQNSFSHLNVDCGHSPNSYGLALETQEQSHIVSSTVSNAGNIGILLLDSVRSDVSSSQAQGGTYGLEFSGEDGQVGCNSSSVTGGSYNDNAAYGIVFASGSQQCSAESLTADRNGSVGILFNAFSVIQKGNRLTNVETSENRTFGVWITPGAGGTAVSGLVVSNNGLAGVTIQDDALLTNVTANNSFVPSGAPLTSQVTLYQTAGSALISGLTVQDTQATANANIRASGGTMTLANANVKIAPGNYGVLANGGTLRLTHSVFAPIGAPSGERAIYTGSSKSTVQIGAAVDLTASTTPISGVGTTTMEQEQGVFTSAISSGVEMLTQVQAKAQGIQTSQSLSGNVTEVVPAGIAGLQYLVYNGARLNGFTWSVGVAGGTAVTLAAGEQALLQTDGQNMQRAIAPR